MNESLSNIFIVGAPRSGTSALGWALAEHPQMWTSTETNILYFLLRDSWIQLQFNNTLRDPSIGIFLQENKISFEEFAAYLGKGFDLLMRSRSSDRIWIDSSPAYTNVVPQLMVYFPQAKFIHILRQGQAVVNSMLKSGFPDPAFQSFHLSCETWVHYATLGRQAAEKNPERVLEVRHEDLTANPERVFDRIYGFLGLEPCAESSVFIRTKRINSSYLNASPEDVQNKIKDPAMMPREPWQAWTADQRRMFGRLCGETMLRLGYDMDSVARPQP